jgi:glutathione S-transferase
VAEYTFFTNPMSRGQIARWALHETDADYAQKLVEWGDKTAEFLSVNPMGKVPTIVHHTPGGDRVVTEAAAVCHYLAEMHPQANLLPKDDEMADYFRWLLFAAGPIEQMTTTKALKFTPTPQQEASVGFGSAERVLAALEGWFENRDWVCGNRFTMADVYVGSQIDWGMNFGTIPPHPAFAAYAERFQARPGYKAAKAIDNKLIEEKKK